MNARTATVLEVDQDVQTARQRRARHSRRREQSARPRNRRRNCRSRTSRRSPRSPQPMPPRSIAIRGSRRKRSPPRAPSGCSASRCRANFGGEGASIADVVDVCYALGRACASTAMIYAMHQTKVACLVRHGQASAWHQLCCAGVATSNCCSRPRPPKARAAATSATAPRRSSATARASRSSGRRR